MIRIPWPKMVVDILNAGQRDPCRHPYTCGNRDPESMANHADGEGVLVATANGWVCPWCDYRQDWAHAGDSPKPVVCRGRNLEPGDFFYHEGNLHLATDVRENHHTLVIPRDAIRGPDKPAVWLEDGERIDLIPIKFRSRFMSAAIFTTELF